MTTNFSPVQALKFKLAGGGITSTATTIILQSFKTSTGTNLTTSDFGALGLLVIEPGTSRTETISFTTVTQNADGTATLTGVTRGLGPITPYAEASGNKFAHSGGSIAILSNPAAFYGKYPAKANDEQITGYWTVPTPLGANDIVNKAYADSLAMSGTGVSTDSVKVAGTAGETVAAGQVVYYKAADGRWWLTDADTASTIDAVQLGIAQGAGTAGNAISGGVLLRGIDTNQSGLTLGTKYYVSNTAGAISSSAGTFTRTIGNAKSTTSLYFDSYFGEQLTGKEKEAVAGSQGVVGTANKFITQDNTSAGGTDQSQTTQNATTVVGEADATLKKNKIAQSFVPTKTKMRGVILYKSADTGTFTGTVTVSLQADSAGAPSGSALGTVTMTNAVWTQYSAGEVEFVFSSEYASLVAGSTYWIVIQTSTSDNSNHPNLGTNSAGGYSSGSVKYNNTTDGWVAVSTIDLYFKTIEGVNSQILKSDSSGAVGSGFKLPSGKIGSTTTEQSIANGSDTTEKTLFEATVPGGSLSTGNVLEFKARFSNIGWTSTNLSFKVYYGGTAILDTTGSSGLTPNSYRGYWEGEILADGSTSAQKCSQLIWAFKTGVEIAADSSVGFSKAVISNMNTSSIDSSVDQQFKLVVQYSGAASENDYTFEYAYLKLIR